MAVNFKDLAERSLWTAVQAAAGVFGAATLSGMPSLATWASVGAAAGIAGVIAVAKSLGVQASTVAQLDAKVDAVADVAAPYVPAVEPVRDAVDSAAVKAETVLATPADKTPAEVAKTVSAADALAAMKQA